jgi:hypothetical protein
VADLRNRYAPDPGNVVSSVSDDLVARLSVKQVRAYLGLPDDRRDEWFDRGHRLGDVEQFRAPAESTTNNATPTMADGQTPSPQSDDAPATAEVRPAAVTSPQTPSGATTETPQSAPTRGLNLFETVADADRRRVMVTELQVAWQKATAEVRKSFLADRLAVEPKFVDFLRSVLAQPQMPKGSNFWGAI